MKKLATVLVAAAAALAPLAPLGQAAQASTAPGAPGRQAGCVVGWGTSAKHAGGMVTSRVLAVRAGEHRCFDRLVFDLGRGPTAGFRVQYVRHIIADGSGRTLHVRGGARLMITIQAPAARRFPASARNLTDVRGFRTFRQVRGAGTFEGITSAGLGVRTKLPFRVFAVHGPGPGSRLVIDVANHR
jgi:hypothetical protein